MSKASCTHVGQISAKNFWLSHLSSKKCFRYAKFELAEPRSVIEMMSSWSINSRVDLGKTATTALMTDHKGTNSVSRLVKLKRSEHRVAGELGNNMMNVSQT